MIGDRQAAHADQRAHRRGDGMRRADQRQRAGERLAQQNAQEQRGEEQAAAKAGADGDRGRRRLQDHQQRRATAAACTVEKYRLNAPCPEDSTAGVTSARPPTASAPDHRAQPDRNAAAAEQVLGDRYAAHDGDAQQGAQHAQCQDRDVVQRFDRVRNVGDQVEDRSPPSARTTAWDTSAATATGAKVPSV